MLSFLTRSHAKRKRVLTDHSATLRTGFIPYERRIVARILVIDDEEGVRGMLGQALARAGYEVLEAQNSRQGLHLARTVTVDLILSDIFLFGQEDLATIAILRREFPAVKIIVMSGGDRIGNLDIADAIRPLGVDGVLKKPFELHELLETIQEVFQE